MSEDDVVVQQSVFGSAAVVLTQLKQPLSAAVAALRIGRAGGAMTILNPAPALPLSDSVLSTCDYITPYETEAKILTGIEIDGPDAAVRAGRRLQEAGAGAAVIKLGQEGACLVGGDDPVFVPAMPAGAVVDTTGAGDAFNGGLAVALSRGASPVDAMRFACAVAGISVTREGAGASMPTAGEVQALFHRESRPIAFSKSRRDLQDPLGLPAGRVQCFDCRTYGLQSGGLFTGMGIPGFYVGPSADALRE